jgi:hypothetical protein
MIAVTPEPTSRTLQYVAIVAPLAGILLTYLLSRFKLKAISVNVDGNLQKAVELAQTHVDIAGELKKEVDGLHRTVEAQAAAMKLLTDAVKQNGKDAHRGVP